MRCVRLLFFFTPERVCRLAGTAARRKKRVGVCFTGREKGAHYQGKSHLRDTIKFGIDFWRGKVYTIPHQLLDERYEVSSRSVAQPGSAFASGAKGRGFKSLRSDQWKLQRVDFDGGFAVLPLMTMQAGSRHQDTLGLFRPMEHGRAICRARTGAAHAETDGRRRGGPAVENSSRFRLLHARRHVILCTQNKLEIVYRWDN